MWASHFLEGLLNKLISIIIIVRPIKLNENCDIALAMSSSHADPVLGNCPGWGYLNI